LLERCRSISHRLGDLGIDPQVAEIRAVRDSKPRNTFVQAAAESASPQV
jgi:hypothetical protein